MRMELGVLSDTNLSLDFESLPEELQTLLAEAVDEYVIAIEEGRAPNRSEFLDRFQSIRDPLHAYLDEIDWLIAGSQNSSECSLTTDAATSTGLAYDDFEIDGEIGRGAMGIVYRAFQKSLQRWVAVKVLPYGVLLDNQRTQRFWREAKIAGTLEHPGIVKVYGFGRHKDICFYVMPLVEGQSLDRHILECEAHVHDGPKRTSQISPETQTLIKGPQRYHVIAKLIGDAADAIHAAHSVGVIHRDIKPSNLIVDSRGRVKVTDFGLAIDTAELKLTRSGEVVGTIRYMSPEQAAGKRGLVDQRSDVYCLGATLYELLTLRPPFDSESLADVVRRKEEGLLTPPRSIDTTIPKVLQTITLKAMRPDPADRYQTAAQLAMDLRCYLDGQPISAVDRSIFEKTSCLARRNIGVVLTSVICLALLFAVAVAFNIAQRGHETALQKALLDREKNLQSARRAVDQLGIDFAEKLELIPEATELRRDLLRSSLTYYEEFLHQAKGDTRLTQAVAEAKWKAAQATAGLESLDEAAKLYEAADQELGELIESHPNLACIRAEMLSEWAMRYMGRFQGEASQPTTALSILERMPSDDERLSVSCRALLKNNRAFVLASLHRTQESIRCASEAVALLGTHADDHAADGNARSLCVSMLNLSKALDAAGQTKAALNVVEQCANYLEGLPSTSSDFQACQLQARAFATFAALRWKHEGAEAAINGLQTVVNIHSEALNAWPSSIDLRWDLAIALNNLGMALSSLSDSNSELAADAEQAFQKAYAIANAETEADRNNALAAQRAANIQNNLGMLLRKMGREHEASKALVSADSHIQRAVLLAPGNEGILHSLQRIQANFSSR